MSEQMTFGGVEPPKREDMMVALAELPSNEKLPPREDNPDLERSLKLLGQIAPVVLARCNGHLEVVAGVGRIKAARKLGWTHVRASVGDLDASDRLVGLHENLARADHPIQAIAAVWALARQDKSAKEIAQELPGLTASQVRMRLELLKLPVEAQRAVLEGRLLVSAAQQAAKEGPTLHHLLVGLLADPAKKKVGPADIAALRATLPRPQASFEEVFGFTVPTAAEVEGTDPDPARAWERRAAGALRDMLLGAPRDHPARDMLLGALRLVAQED